MPHDKQICLCECHQDVFYGVQPHDKCCDLEYNKYIDKAGNVDIYRLAGLRTKLTIAVDAAAK